IGVERCACRGATLWRTTLGPASLGNGRVADVISHGPVGGRAVRGSAGTVDAAQLASAAGRADVGWFREGVGTVAAPGPAPAGRAAARACGNGVARPVGHRRLGAVWRRWQPAG